MLSFFKNRFLNLFFSSRCLLCQEPIQTSGAVCPDCFSKIDFLRPPFCQSCGLPVKEKERKKCPACLHEKLPFSTVVSAVAYDDVSKKFVLSLKYGADIETGRFMGRIMFLAGKDLLKQADVLMPVPLHRFRLLKRRFNQSMILAEELSKKSGVPTDAFSLVRKKHTKKQGHFSKEKRRENVRKAFHVVSNEKIKGKKIVLIDDVMTTGATVHACAKVLKKAGAKQVTVLTFARVVK